jgi:hypothetical protein
MKRRMKPLRRPLLMIATWSLRTLLFIGVPLLGILIYFGNADYLESTLKSAHAYDSFVPAVTETLASSSQGDQGIPFTDPGVRQIISNGLPPQVLEDSSDKVIDSLYGWLEGKTIEPKFTVDLTKNREYISENISLYAFNRLTKQPVCFENPKQINPFTATCLPVNFDLNAEKASFSAAIEQAFPKTVFTAADLPKMSGGKTIAQAIPNAPTYYRWFKLSPLVLSVLLIVCCVSIVKLCRTNRLGFRLLGSVSLSTGVALMITPVLYLLAYPRINGALHLQSADTGLNALGTTVAGALSSTFYIFLIKASLIIINLGLVIVLLERFTRSIDYQLVANKAGLVSTSPRKKGKMKQSPKYDRIPLISSERSSQKRPGKALEKFRKVMDKELS